MLFLPGISWSFKALSAVRRQGFLFLTLLLCVLYLPVPGLAAGPVTDSLEVTQDSIRYYYPPHVIEESRWDELEVRSDLHLTVIDSERLTRTAALDIGEVIGKSPGVVLTKTGGPGSQELLSIRGSTSQQVLVLLNGRRLNTAQGGGTDLSQFEPWDVSRIEIYPEGNDARFGAASMGGILNIVTAPVVQRGLRLRTLGGSYGTRSVSLRASGGKKIEFSATGSYRTVDNDFAFEDPRRGDTRRRINAGVEGKSLSGRLVSPAGGAGKLSLFLSASGEDRGAPGPIEFPTPEARLEDDRFFVQGDLTGKKGQVGLTLGGGLNSQKRRYNNPDPVLWADDLHENTTASLSIDAERNLFRRSLLATGASVEEDHLRSTTDGAQNRRSYASYVSTTLRILPDGAGVGDGLGADRGVDSYDASDRVGSKISVTTGVRLEKVGSYDLQALPSISSRVTLVRDVLILRGSVGRKYRPPSFDELFWPLSSGAEGNPDLRPEYSNSTELSGTAYLLDRRFRIRGTWFSRRLTDLIEWMPGAGGIWRPHNVGRAREKGIEIEGGFSGDLPAFLPPVSLQISHSIIRATDEGDDATTTGNQLVRRPVSISSAVFEAFPATSFSLGLSWTRMGKRYLTRANTKWLDGHHVFDFDLKRELWRGTSLIFSIKNRSTNSSRRPPIFSVSAHAKANERKMVLRAGT